MSSNCVIYLRPFQVLCPQHHSHTNTQTHTPSHLPNISLLSHLLLPNPAPSPSPRPMSRLGPGGQTHSVQKRLLGDNEGGQGQCHRARLIERPPVCWRRSIVSLPCRKRRGTAQLPQSSTAQLPQSSRAQLPQSGRAQLPQSGRAQLPQSER